MGGRLLAFPCLKLGSYSDCRAVAAVKICKVAAGKEEPVGFRVPLPIGVGYQVLGLGPIRGPRDPLWRHQEGGGTSSCARGWTHKLSPNAADHGKRTNPAEGGADGHLILNTDSYLSFVSDWEIEGLGKLHSFI